MTELADVASFICMVVLWIVGIDGILKKNPKERDQGTDIGLEWNTTDRPFQAGIPIGVAHFPDILCDLGGEQWLSFLLKLFLTVIG